MVPYKETLNAFKVPRATPRKAPALISRYPLITKSETVIFVSVAVAAPSSHSMIIAL